MLGSLARSMSSSRARGWSLPAISGTEQLKEVMAANQGVATLTDKIAGLCFRAEDEESLETMSKTISDSSIAALGRMQIAQVQDSSWKAPARSRAQRIADETKRALAMKDLKASALLAMNPFIMDSNPAVKLAAPTWDEGTQGQR